MWEPGGGGVGGTGALCLLSTGALLHRALLRDMRLRYRSSRCRRLGCRSCRCWRTDCRSGLCSLGRLRGLSRCRGCRRRSRRGRSSRPWGRRFDFRLLVRPREFALLRFNDDSLRAAVAEILAHGALLDAWPLHGQRLLRINAQRLVVVRFIAHYVSVSFAAPAALLEHYPTRPGHVG